MRIVVGTRADLGPGEVRTVAAGGRSVALCNVDGRYFAIDSRCPHRGGPLGEGELSGSVVTCPWHGWQWNVETGASVNNPAVRVQCIPVRIDSEDVVLDLDTPDPGGA